MIKRKISQVQLARKEIHQVTNIMDIQRILNQIRGPREVKKAGQRKVKMQLVVQLGSILQQLAQMVLQELHRSELIIISKEIILTINYFQCLINRINQICIRKLILRKNIDSPLLRCLDSKEASKAKSKERERQVQEKLRYGRRLFNL